MPSWIVDPATGELVPSEDYYMEKAIKKYNVHMTVGNRLVNIYYNSDEMPPTRHMINGKYYTSKKKFRDETRARGCIEVGNETKTLTKRRKPVKLDRRRRRNDIKKAIYDLKNGNVPK